MTEEKTNFSLEQLGVSEKKRKQFKKKNINSINDLLLYFPKYHYDYSKITDLNKERPCINLNIDTVRSGTSSKGIHYIFACGKYNENEISVGWFNCQFLLDDIIKTKGQEVIVAGKCVYDIENNKYTFISPDIYTTNRNEMGIFPVYSKIPGMSDSYLKECIANALNLYSPNENGYLPYPAEKRFNLPSYSRAIYMIHKPNSLLDVMLAKKRFMYDDLYLFGTVIENEKKSQGHYSHVYINNIDKTKHFMRNIPFPLTEDQKKTVSEIYEKIKRRECVHALIQGDVGCGKTIVSMIIASMVSENGFQTAILAPTSVLAQQHYADFNKTLGPILGDTIAFVPPLTSIKKAEKQILVEDIKSGNKRILIGTHSLLSDEIQFNNLGLIITDEEHKFGVEQREKLLEKTSIGSHYLTMSATPIPRSLAGILYGERGSVYSIKTMPGGREPVQTAINHNWNSCCAFIRKQIQQGRQVYVVCPQVDDGYGDGKIDSVKTLTKKYMDCFGAENVAGLSGKTSKKEMKRILDAFKNNEIKILVATTVIEVGVNVPNANTIIIHNAERFGLAALHQLRGRVGRGGGKAYCILFSSEKDNPRLLAMCKTNDGFEIAEEDLRLRGAGELIGTAQSGISRYTDTVLRNQEDYNEVKNYIREKFRD